MLGYFPCTLSVPRSTHFSLLPRLFRSASEPEDLLSDGLGSWNQSKTAAKKYLLTTQKGDRM